MLSRTYRYVPYSLRPMRRASGVLTSILLHALIAILLLALLGLAVWRLLRRRESANVPASGATPAMTHFFVIFMVVAFILWMKMFAVYRYAVVCEFLVPLTIFLVLGALLRNARQQRRTALFCMVFLLVTIDPGHWGRRPWTSDYFDVHLPALAEPPNTIVLVTGHDPMSVLLSSTSCTTCRLRMTPAACQGAACAREVNMKASAAPGPRPYSSRVPGFRNLPDPRTPPWS